MAGIYLHIPFCKRACGYCDFFKSIDCRALDSVVAAMMEELAESANFLNDKHIDTIYFGGGTPSLLSVEQVRGFVCAIRSTYECSADCEITLEANPDDLSRDYLEGLRAAGVNRLSIGVQSFDDGALRFMNRRHDAAHAVAAVELAKAVGFNNITIDLIFGVDGFGEDVLRRSIEQAIALDVQHISAYHLTIESGTLFGRREARGELQAVDELVSESEYMLVHQLFTNAGFEHYEISNFARPGYRSRHNSSYWQGVEYLGVGAGAHSFNGSQRRITLPSVEQYLKGGAERYEYEQIDEHMAVNESVMTSLRRCEGLQLSTLPTAQQHRILSEAQIWIEIGALIHDGEWLRIPAEKFLLSDAIIEQLFEV